MIGNVIVLDNPLAKYYLTILRNRETPPSVFREYMYRLGFILGYETSRFINWEKIVVETPLALANGLKPSGKVIIVGILGASIPLVNGMWRAIPWASLGLVAARRIEMGNGVEVKVYYERLKDDLSGFTAIIGDPMLATGSTISAVIEKLVARGCSKVIVASVIASKQGIEYVLGKFRDINIITVEIDPQLNNKFFIVPGLGDAGDRSLDGNGGLDI
ncbi:MAG: uracil phosphoribosyltransferase [Desulfurococcaceae archaeon]